MPHSVKSPSTEESPVPAENQAEQPTMDEISASVNLDVHIEMDADPVQEDDTPMVDAPETEAEETVTKAPEIKLEELFAGMDSDDDDDEFPAAVVKKEEVYSSPEMPSSPGDVKMSASDPELMRSFYQRLFPWRYLFQWLNHSPTPTNDFAHREFAFTLQNDAVMRYQSYQTSDLLRKDIIRLMPTRFEIGPVYTSNPRDRKTLRNSTAFKPLAKELCFDIDLTDYDDIRTCCDKANICHKCWQFMTMSIKVLDTALRDDFGFKHIMWVYSGRRGAHAWVCDKKARAMDDQKRRAIANYLEVIRGGAQSGKKVNLRRPLHPHLSRSLDILKPHFQSDVLEVQDPWRSSDLAEKLLKLLPDIQLADSLRKKWDSSPGRSSSSKWADIDAVTKTGGASKNLDTRALLDAKQDIVLEYTYPRLDIAVSKKLNHLLKSPFVVHPGTGRVCVPIDTRSLEDFDPLGVPTVQGLIQEIDAWKEPESAEGSNKHPVQDWEKTSLKPYIEQFRSFVIALMKDERDVKVKREREDDSATAMEF